MSYDVSDFGKEVIEQSHSIPVLVDFWAEWCGPCKFLGPVIESMAERNSDRWKLAKVNTETQPEIARQYGIQGIPNVKLFVDGEVRDEFTGALPEPMIEQWLKKALPSPNQRQLDVASGWWKEGQTEAARNIIEQVLSDEPDNEQALVSLSRTLLDKDPDHCLALLKPIEPDSDLHDSVVVLRTIAGLYQSMDNPESLADDPIKPVYIEAINQLRQGAQAQALELFISVLEKNRSYDDDGARRSCVAIFGLLGGRFVGLLARYGCQRPEKCGGGCDRKRGLHDVETPCVMCGDPWSPGGQFSVGQGAPWCMAVTGPMPLYANFWTRFPS